MEPLAQLGGLLLCRVAEHRIAFPAWEVVSVEPAGGGDAQVNARRAFGLEPTRGKALVSESGDSVAVDAVEVCQDRVALLPGPPMLARAAGGSVWGFVEVRAALWPVLHVAEFSRFLSERSHG